MSLASLTEVLQTNLAATNLDPKLQELIAFLESQQGAAETGTPKQTVSSETPANSNLSQPDLLAITASDSSDSSTSAGDSSSPENASQSNT